jgi:hypothetical protein
MFASMTIEQQDEVVEGVRAALGVTARSAVGSGRTGAE